MVEKRGYISRPFEAVMGEWEMVFAMSIGKERLVAAFGKSSHMSWGGEKKTSRTSIFEKATATW